MSLNDERKAALTAYGKQLMEQPDFEAALETEIAFQTTFFAQRIRQQTRDAMLKKRCQHPAELQEYWPDPSGNNGGGWACGFCGKDL